MDRKKTIIISITGIIVTILALLGFTYGYYLTAIQGNENSKSVELVTGVSSVLFTDLSASDTSEIIEPGYEMTKSFTVENTGEITATYSIYFVDVYNDFVRTEDVRYKLYRIDNNSEFPTNYEGCVTNPTDEKQCKIIVEDAEFPTDEESLIQANEQILVTGDTYRYDLIVTYINHPTINQNADQGHIFRAKINLKADTALDLTTPFKKGTLAYSILNNAKNNLNGTVFMETPPSKVAEEISLPEWDLSVTSIYYDDESIKGYAESEDALFRCYIENIDPDTEEPLEYDCSAVKEYTSCTDDVKGNYVYDSNNDYIFYVSDCENGKILIGVDKSEKVLSIAEDDLGTGISYYYRGNVKDNYVNFAGMCWRIVRIAGDGSIKLILDDLTNLCNDESYTGDWIIFNEDTAGEYSYGYERKDVQNEPLWQDEELKEEKESIMNYLNPVEYAEHSMVKVFYDFQTTKLAGYTDKLKAGDWCLSDKAFSRNGSFGSYTYTLLDEYDYTIYDDDFPNMYYDAHTRLIDGNINGYKPSLKCNGTIMNKFERVIYKDSVIIEEAPMYVSTITADEVVYAGGVSSESNFSYYLVNGFINYNNESLILLTPAYTGFDLEFVFNIDPHGMLIENSIDFDGYIRPSVSLASNVKISSGDGTIESPYVIE